MISGADIAEAHARLATITRPTPVESCDTLSRIIGRPIILKPEHRQRTGSYKIRGAYNLISRLELRSRSHIRQRAAKCIAVSMMQ